MAAPIEEATTRAKTALRIIRLLAGDAVGGGSGSRRLLRAHPEISKPPDAIHVATALLYDIDELHTFDRKDLLALNGVLDRADGKKLSICPQPTPPPPAEKPGPLPSLFDQLEKPLDAEGKREAEG